MIRPVTEQDADTITDIYNHYIQNSTATFEEKSVDKNNIIERIHKVNKADLPWLVAINKGVVVGYAYATPWKDRSAYRYSVESTVYCAPKNIGQGWGFQLYDALLTELRRLPIHSVLGGITLPNPASVSLHEKLGMRKVAHFEKIGFKFDQWLDTGYWQITFHR